MSKFSPLAHWLNDARLCLAFSTRLPLASPPGESHRLGRALRLNALAGVVVGGFGATVYWLAAALGLPVAVAALLSLAAALWFTAALHEDGLADFVDAMGGGRTRAKALEIMRDSRIGAFGAAALFLSLALRVALLAALGEPPLVFAGLVASHAFARGLLPTAMLVLPPARRDGLAASLNRPKLGDAALGLLLGSLVALAGLGFGAALVASAAALLAAGAVLLIARRRLGGYTGDVLGAVEQVSEIAMLMGIVVMVL
jgi:adenosylcobinamide-GDP ribazoletransferase